MTTNPETPRDRIARHFGLGQYGKHLAAEILRSYGEMLAVQLEEQGEHKAAKYLREINGGCDD